MPRAKFWCFTSFKDEPPQWSKEILSYLTYQRERCPNTQRLHWQGYLALHRSGSRRIVRDFLGVGVHIASANSAKAIDYCHKEESRVPGTQPVEFGERPAPSAGKGARSDIAAACALVLSGATPATFAKEFPATYVRYFRGLTALKQALAPKRNLDVAVSVSIYIGPPGCGKTKTAYAKWPNLFSKPPGPWWDGYDGETVTLFDDFVGEDAIPPSELLKICDRYPLQVQVKGSFRELQATRIIFTSNVEWEEWYLQTRYFQQWGTLQAAFKRRISEVVRDFEGEEEKKD